MRVIQSVAMHCVRENFLNDLRSWAILRYLILFAELLTCRCGSNTDFVSIDAYT